MDILPILKDYFEGKKFRVVERPASSLQDDYDRIIVKQEGRRGWLVVHVMKDTTIRAIFKIESGNRDAIFLDMAEPKFFEQLLKFARKSMRPHRHLRGGR